VVFLYLPIGLKCFVNTWGEAFQSGLFMFNDFVDIASFYAKSIASVIFWILSSEF
jgi:hypothetical protein